MGTKEQNYPSCRQLWQLQQTTSHGAWTVDTRNTQWKESICSKDWNLKLLVSSRLEMDNIQKLSRSADAESNSTSIKRLSDALDEVLYGELPKKKKKKNYYIYLI